MKFLIAILLFSPFLSLAQFKVTVIIDKVPADTRADNIYIMGNFNDWTPGDPQNVLVKDQAGKYSTIFTDVPAALYEYKFNLGTLESIETKADGSDLANRLLNLQSDTVVRITIGGWKNAPKTSSIQTGTATRNEYLTGMLFISRNRLVWTKPD